MTNFIKYFAIIGIFASGLACEKKSLGDGSQRTLVAELAPAHDFLVPDAVVVPVEKKISSSGNSLRTSTVIDRQSTTGESPAGEESMTWEEIIVAFPVLAERVMFLGRVDKVIETDAHTIDLYSGETLVITLKYNQVGDSLLVVSSTQVGFAADLITFETVVSERSHGAVIDTIDFMISTCLPHDQPQDQEQVSKSSPNEKCAAIIVSIWLKQVIGNQVRKQEAEPPIADEKTFPIPEPVPVPGHEGSAV